VRAIFHDQNVGVLKNFARLYEMSHGQYFAVLDGDDYWTHPEKLQKQVDFLDAHPDYSICFHSDLMVWEDGSHASLLHFPPDRKDTYRLEDLLVHDFISASSQVVRNKLIKEFPAWYWRAPFNDWPFVVLNAMHGKIGYIDECWSVYRQRGAGVYSGISRQSRIEQHIQLGRLFLEAFDAQYHPALRRALSNRLMRMAILQRRAGRPAEARDYGRQYIQECGGNSLTRLRNRAKLAIYMRCPAIPNLISKIRYAGRDCMKARDLYSVRPAGQNEPLQDTSRRRPANPTS
jgi:glycosyltransferase involved in cell wall biosynthesis